MQALIKVDVGALSVLLHLVNSVRSLRCKYKNLSTRPSEIDLAVEYLRSKREIPRFEELGR